MSKLPMNQTWSRRTMISSVEFDARRARRRAAARVVSGQPLPRTWSG